MKQPIQPLKNDEFYDHLRQKTGQAIDRYPLKCQWEITCRCNFKCVMCYTDCFNTPSDIARELSTSEIFRIMNELKDAGVLELTFTGGEPLSRPDFELIYTRAIQNGFLVDIYTHGAFINAAWISIFKKLPPNNIEISLHGLSAETFDQVTARPGSFEKVRQAIHLIVENHLPLTLKMTGLPINQHEILQVKTWVSSLKNVRFRFGSKIRKLANGDTAPLKFQLPESFLTELFESDEDFNRCFCEQSKTRESQGKPTCNDARKQFHIDAYGNLQLCSGNRLKSYDLRKGPFKEGYYNVLPHFPCPFKGNATRLETETLQNIHENDYIL